MLSRTYKTDAKFVLGLTKRAKKIIGLVLTKVVFLSVDMIDNKVGTKKKSINY